MDPLSILLIAAGLFFVLPWLTLQVRQLVIKDKLKEKKHQIEIEFEELIPGDTIRIPNG